MNASMIQPSADDRATGFTATTDTGEQYDGYTLMVEAYAALWLILMAWLVLVWRKQATLTTRVDGLEAALARAEKRAGATAAPRAAGEEPKEPSP